MKTLPVFPLAPDPIRSDVARDVEAVRLSIDPIGPADGPHVGLVTLGCDKNTVDSEKMMAALVGHGARVSSDVSGSDVVVVNTCGFIESAKEQSIETILEACRLKDEGRVRAVVVVGCLVQRYKDELSTEIPEVDLFLGLSEMACVAWIRDAIPDVTLRTTVIVGFPGESEDDFRGMLDLLEEIRFDRVGAFTYSVEDGTPAADMPDQIPDSLKRERFERLMDVQRMISSERNEALIGRRFRALVDEVLDDPGPLGTAAAGRPVGVARTVGQALDVDGVTHVHPFEGLAPGQFVTLEIDDAEEYDLMAHVVESV